MMTIKIFAGLGNQLFQYSYGLWLRAHGERVNFMLSPSPGCITDVFKLKDRSVLEVGNPIVAAAVKAWSRYIEHSYVVGFHQRHEYAETIREIGGIEFKRQEAYARSPWATAAGSGSAVSVHVRGGDYLADGAAGLYGSVCSPGYYNRSFDLISERIVEPEFLVLTDDSAHAVRMLEGVGHAYRIVTDDSFADDPGFHLWMMQTCKHHIIANSTFSWWGAFLGAAPGGITVCPDRWTSDRSVNLDDLVPETWIRAATTFDVDAAGKR